jgi:Fe2+ transport system protein FeoA
VGRLVLIAVAVLAVGAAIAGAIVLISSNSKSATAATKVDARTVTVAVLNGTSIAGLAHRISQRLVALGFVKGAVTTAADQTRTSTTVAYIPGARTQALAVARALKLGAASVAPVDQGTRTVACEGLSTCTASVMVTVGSDLTNR